MTAKTDSIGLLALPLGVVGAGFVALVLSAAVTVAPLTAPARVQEETLPVPVFSVGQDASTVAQADFLRRNKAGQTVTIPGIGEVHLPTADAHAVAKHGDNAWLAIAAAMTGGDGGKYRCDDQDKWYIVRYLRRGMSVLLVGMTSHDVITAFVSEVRAEPWEQDGCTPLDGRRFLHP